MSTVSTPPRRISNNKVGLRQSNIELLRIVAMFLVLIVHSGFISVRSPSTSDVHLHFIQPFTRFLFESLSISCVDIFVLISGWFGIRPTKKGLYSFIFQVFYFTAGTYLIMVLFGLASLSLEGIASCFLFIPDYDYWFVRTYLLLFILSPVLNSFVDSVDKKTFRNVLIGFFLFQTIYAWGYVAVNAFAGGYSTISFMGLYLLARYVRLYEPGWAKMPVLIDFLIIIGCIVSMAAISYVTAFLGHPLSGKFCGSYICPLVIILALYMVIAFSKLKIQSKFVNWVAASCFAVYLFHTHITIFYDYFKPTVVRLYSEYDGLLCLAVIGLFLFIVFSVSIVLDQPRKWLWNSLTRFTRLRLLKV